MDPTPGKPNAVVEMGLLRAAPLSVVLEEERAAAQLTQAKPLNIGLAAHVRKCWSDARMAKQQSVETRMLENMRARRGEYDPDKLAQIRGMGGAEIYTNLTSVKCRAAASWLRDVLMATGTERPWTLKPTPVPELPADMNEQIVALVTQHIQQMEAAGASPTDHEVLSITEAIRDETLTAEYKEAVKRVDRMAVKMEDQLVEGGFLRGLDAFIDDIVTFPCAVMKGPVVRRRKALSWTPQEDGTFKPTAVDELRLEWERVSPFDVYPAPSATTVDNGFLIEKHKLSREDLQAMIGVPDYDAASIRTVLDEYGRGGLREWLTNDVAIAAAQGQSTVHIASNTDSLIDALQYWGTVQGKMLREWGMKDEEVPDPSKEYHVEVWLIGHYVIKATLNYDPLCRKPYYKASYEDVPGSWWGNSVADLVRDSQEVVNASARAIVNNMGIASGPQVIVNVDRLASGEEITNLTPWRIWQVTNDPGGSNADPITFKQPESRIRELIGVFEKFSQMADEYSGIPRYMAGENPGTLGRTASGLSMLMGNANKAIKQVVANIDIGVLNPLVERLYNHNMQYADDPDLKGDVKVIARGASSIISKETAQMRRNEFLMATANPVDMQIVGVEGRHALLREQAKTLDVDVDRVVPPLNMLQQKLAAMAAANQGQQGSPPAPQKPGGGETLATGEPTTDNFSPQPQA